MPNRRLILTIVLLLSLCLGVQSTIAANRLAGHPSPYLALHGEDPVEWRDWQAEVFDAARKDNRLVLVSIGYYSCHWCHVMQRESYQDDTVAARLNESFIAVKVDRELDPDLDQRLIAFVERVRGSAGWPLNVFLTPEGYPVTGFTYLPRDRFLYVLEQLDAEWRERHDELGRAARIFFEREMVDPPDSALDAPDLPAARLVDAFVAQSMLAADELQGGFGNTSKFPNAPQLAALLEVIAGDPKLDPDVADFMRLTLDVMAARHLTDHVDGGFFRYTTDPDWQTPHFEKMLYDNAQLASLYLRAHRLWPDRGYAGVALRTLDFVEARLRHPDGGYMSSLSAVDVDNVEGGAYWWTRADLETLLTADDLAYLEKHWQIDPARGQVLPRPLIGPGANGDDERNRRILERLRQQPRPPMPADDKRLAGWNALLLEALVLAAPLEERQARRAHALYQKMRDHFVRGDEVVRFVHAGGAIAGQLEDYALLAHAFDVYGRAFDDAAARTIAARLVARTQALFLHDGRWRHKRDTLIPVAPGDWIAVDRVLPSPMSRWLEVALAAPGVSAEVRATARGMLLRSTRNLLDAPYFYGSFILLRSTYAG